MSDEHSQSLDYIVENIDLFEDKFDIHSIVREGTWIIHGRQTKFPDLLLIYDSNEEYPNGHVIPLEYKRIREKIYTALQQLQNGAKYSREVLKKVVPYGVFVYGTDYRFERLSLRSI